MMVVGGDYSSRNARMHSPAPGVPLLVGGEAGEEGAASRGLAACPTASVTRAVLPELVPGSLSLCDAHRVGT